VAQALDGEPQDHLRWPRPALIPLIAILERGSPHLRPVDLDGDDDLLRPVAPDEVLWRVAARGRPAATRSALPGQD